MHDLHETELLSACRILFGPEVQLGTDFLGYLQPEGAKVAYRKRARESHPDAHPWAPSEQRQRLHDEFTLVAQAYQTLQAYLAVRNKPQQTNRAGRCSPNARKARQTSPAKARAEELYYHGPVPWIELKLGRYLYFRGLVSYQEVLRSLRWQRGQRPSIGQLARRWGWLDNESVHAILQASSVIGRFGERAVQLGLLGSRHVRELLAAQQQLQPRLGRYFIKRGLLQEAQLAILDYERLVHNQAVAAGDSAPHAS